MKYLAVAASGLLLSACATSASNVQAAYVSPLAYQSYGCQQLAAESRRVQSRVQQVSGAVNSNATNDAVATGVALVVFWPAAFLIEGDGAQTQELSRLKGEHEAIDQAAISKNCAAGGNSVIAEIPSPSQASAVAYEPAAVSPIELSAAEVRERPAAPSPRESGTRKTSSGVKISGAIY